MNHYFLNTAFAISILLNLFFAFHSIPEKNEVIEFWKRQCKIWRESYFKQLSDEKNKTGDSETFKQQGKGRPWNPGPPPEEEITG